MNKKSQIHLSETVAIIFIFFILILFAAIFYFNFQKVAFKEKQKELVEARAIDVITKSLFLPEFLCSKGEAEPESNCLDMMKVRNSAKIFERYNQTYFEIFSYATITINQTYPEHFKMIVYDQKPPVWEQKKPTFFVVSLKDEAQGKDFYGFGHLIVEVYS
ncbi:MAG TPA: hypothetical protein VJI98_04875 [Candidatus Nanoarchaeia archaeon]|nr:hypothetical protein [Candidatus Nanoarchaeia archaeon]